MCSYMGQSEQSTEVFMGAGDVQSLSSVMNVIQLHIITGHAQTHNGEEIVCVCVCVCVCCVLCARTRVCVWCVCVCVVSSCIGMGLLCSQECKCKLFSMSTHTPIHCVPYRVQQRTCF